MASELTPQNVKPFRVLVLDGGGMRGLYTAMVLAGLSRRFLDKPGETPARDVGSAFNLIEGTSTGGVLACALAAGYSPSAIIELYRRHGEEIFPHPVPTEGFVKLFGFAITGVSPKSFGQSSSGRFEVRMVDARS
ncbi:hypothetical protein EPN44_10865 [bacterium]|nr:MAG: hypothetical protein EPN44_10865 [bacterium]